MQVPSLPAAELTHVIQLALGPVVLISGVGLLLLVLTNRLGRIVDRARLLRVEIPRAAAADATHHRNELRVLVRRARLILFAILCSVLCVLGVALLITVLFVSAIAGRPLTTVATLLFTAAILGLTAGMLAFAVEIIITVRTFRLDAEGPEPSGR
jgi:hypothetical protein